MRSTLLLLLLAPVFSIAAAPARFDSPRGFSIVPPDGWEALSKENRDRLTAAVAERLKIGDLDFDKVALVLADPSSAGDSQAPTMNVVVSPGAPEGAPSQSDISSLRDSLQDYFRKMGLDADVISAKAGTFAGRTALAAETLVGSAGSRIHQWQVMIPANGRTFIVTCTAPEASFENVRPIFEASIDSMQFTGSPAMNILDNPPGWLKDAFVGAVIGGLIGLFKTLTGKKGGRT